MCPRNFGLQWRRAPSLGRRSAGFLPPCGGPLALHKSSPNSLLHSSIDRVFEIVRQLFCLWLLCRKCSKTWGWYSKTFATSLNEPRPATSCPFGIRYSSQMLLAPFKFGKNVRTDLLGRTPVIHRVEWISSGAVSSCTATNWQLSELTNQTQ
jgi:hypothetical protein